MNQQAIHLVHYRCEYCDTEFYMDYNRTVARCPKCGNNFAYANADVKVFIEEIGMVEVDINKARELKHIEEQGTTLA